MATLELNIDELKHTEPLDAPVNPFSKFLSHLRTKFPVFKWPVPTPTVVPEGFNPPDYMIFIVLQDFLQPTSSISTCDAVDCILGIFPSGIDQRGSIIGVSLELAAQIPYYHPSQQKLARLLWAVGTNTHRFDKDKWSGGEIESFYQTLGIDLTDSLLQPRGEDDSEYPPDRYVNYVAFIANVLDIGIFRPWSRTALFIMSRALEQRHEEETPRVRDAWVIGAAQLILWHGQGLFKLVLSPEDLDEDGRVPKWLVGEPNVRGPITLETWHLWRSWFVEAADNETYGIECRDVSKKAAEIMKVLEMSMSL